MNELEQKLQDYEAIFSAMPVMLWYKDDKNTTLRINDAAAAFEGVDRSEVEGKSCYDVYPREQADAFFRDDLEVIKSGQPKMNIIEKHTTPQGAEMWVHTNKVPHCDENGKIVGVIAIAIDVTEREKVHQALEAKNRELQRVQEFIRSTLDHVEDSAQRGAERAEILKYLKSARERFESLA